jgi:hypothetical protein
MPLFTEPSNFEIQYESTLKNASAFIQELCGFVGETEWHKEFFPILQEL